MPLEEWTLVKRRILLEFLFNFLLFPNFQKIYNLAKKTEFKDSSILSFLTKERKRKKRLKRKRKVFNGCLMILREIYSLIKIAKLNKDSNFGLYFLKWMKNCFSTTWKTNAGFKDFGKMLIAKQLNRGNLGFQNLGY